MPKLKDSPVSPKRFLKECVCQMTLPGEAYTLARILTGRNASVKNGKLYVRGTRLLKYAEKLERNQIKRPTKLERRLIDHGNIVPSAQLLAEAYSAVLSVSCVKISSKVSDVYRRSRAKCRSCMTYPEVFECGALDLFDKSPNIKIAFAEDEDRNVTARALLFYHKTGVSIGKAYTTRGKIFRDRFLEAVKAKVSPVIECDEFDPGFDLKSLSKWPYMDQYSWVDFDNNKLCMHRGKCSHRACDTEGKLVEACYAE